MKNTIPSPARVLLDFIYRTDAGQPPPKCYETIFGNREGRLPKKLTDMTLDEVLSHQKNFGNKKWVKTMWGYNTASSAVGAAQFMRVTLLGLKKELGLTGEEMFDADFQDRLAYALLTRRGYHDFMAGRLDAVGFGKRLAMEWASLPVLAPAQGQKRAVVRGQSFYAGDGLNKALIGPETVEKVLAKAKATGGPVVSDPGDLKKSPTKSKTVWTWLLTAIGTPLAAFGNFDWRVQLAIVVIITVFAIYGIKRRFDLFRNVKKLMEDFGNA